MSISQALLPEFDQEMANTRKLLERVPDGKSDYKPHEKSMTLGRLAGRLVSRESSGRVGERSLHRRQHVMSLHLCM